MMLHPLRTTALISFLFLAAALAPAPDTFDGASWHITSGNQSVSYIRSSPIGAAPQPNYVEPPPPASDLARMKREGLVALEDYIAWGAVERAPGQWDWRQHDAECDAMKAAGLQYVAYCWVHFPPVWLRDADPDKRTLMTCLEHHKAANYLSIFDPKTIEYYDHFYHALHDHFGDRIDGVFACILGPYGEGNYPLMVDAFVNMGHCHEGYWAGDVYALAAFRKAMAAQYGTVNALNAAWGTSLKSFDEVIPPQQISDSFKPSPAAFPAGGQRRQWIDFITWYHQAIIDFAGQSIRTVLKYFPREKVRCAPGGNAGGVNPIDWGTYCPGYAKMAGPLGITLQAADAGGHVFGDLWAGTAYRFYHVRYGTEPAGGLDHAQFLRRLFSDASAGASQFFTYEFDAHAADMRSHIQLFTGEPADTSVALYCPTTLYRLGGDLQPTIQAATHLRQCTAYDVLDELLIADGALTDHYKALLMFQGDLIDQPILDRLEHWIASGGTLLLPANLTPHNIPGDPWPLLASHAADASFPVGRGHVIRLPASAKGAIHVEDIRQSLHGIDGVAHIPATLDGIWTTRRRSQTIYLNPTTRPVHHAIDSPPDTPPLDLPPGELITQPTTR
jgi:hypothetical protein